MDIKILVAAHKKYWMPDDDVYMSLQVGAEGKESLGYTPDNTGDNISSKNPNYCELTGCTGPGRIWNASILGFAIIAGTLDAGCIRRI